MCYDISFTTNIEEIATYLPNLQLDAQMDLNFTGSDHIQAHADSFYPIIAPSKEGGLKIGAMQWGFNPFWEKDPARYRSLKQYMYNAQSEKVLGDVKSQWHRAKKNRCLIPVGGIYEHRGVKGFKNKVPYYIQVENRDAFCIPGLFQIWKETDPVDGVPSDILHLNFTLLTRSANEAMKQIHNDGPNIGRMPLFLTRELEAAWMDPTATDEQLKAIIDFQMPAESMVYHPVFTIRSSKPRPDGKGKTAYWEWDKLPPLGQGNPEPKSN